MNDMPPYDDFIPEPPSVKASRIKLVAFDDISLSIGRRFLVKGLIPRVGLTVVYGAPKTGKSFWTFDLMMHVALDWRYRGRRIDHGPIVYCCFEGQFGIEARAEAFRQRFLTEAHDPVPFHLELLRLDLVRDHKDLITAIRQTLGDVLPAAIVLDTLNRSLAGSESSDEDMGAYIGASDAIREAFDCAVIVVHHSGLDTSRPRGHTSLLGAADAQLSVKRDSADNIVVTVEYMKDGPQGEVVVSRLDSLEVGVDVDGDAITSCVIVPVEGAAAPKPSKEKAVKLTAAAKIALRALEDVIASAGQPSPGGDHIPGYAVVVKFEDWRRQAYSTGISDSTEESARRMAFKRAAESLVGANVVGRWEAYCWKI